MTRYATGFGSGLRDSVHLWFYNNSHLYRYTEELIGHAVGKHSWEIGRKQFVQSAYLAVENGGYGLSLGLIKQEAFALGITGLSAGGIAFLLSYHHYRL